MTFLSTGLLAGLFAAAIPIALHLIARQQPRRVVFPGTRFVKASLDTQRDRLKVRRWWLLAMRILALAALAIALARPQIHTTTAEAWFLVAAIAVIGLILLVLATLAVFRGQSKPLRYGLAIAGLVALIGSLGFGGATLARAPSATVTDQSPMALAIVIDNSIRSTRLVDDDAELLELMRTAANQIIAGQSSDSLIAVIDRSPKPATFAMNSAAALTRVERLEPAYRVRPLADQVRAAIALVRSSELERRSVIVVTDLSRTSWNEAQWRAANFDSLLAQSPPLNLQILDLGSESVANYSLGQVKISDPTPPRLAKTSLDLIVQSPRTGDTKPKSSAVQLDLYDTDDPSSAGLPVVRDGKIVLPPLRSVDRASVESTTAAERVLLSMPPLEVGTHHAVVRLMVDDELAADNLRFLTLVVSPPKRLLIVGSDRVEAETLSGALNVSMNVDDSLAEYIIETSEFLPVGQAGWSAFDAVLMIDPVAASPPAQADIESYLKSGGSVIVFLGPAMTVEEGVPSFVRGVVLPWRIPAPGTFLEVLRSSDPAVDSLSDVAGGVPWNQFRVSQYWQVEREPNDQVIVQYAGTGHAAIFRRSVGDGSLLVMTTPLPALVPSTRAWNRLFAGSNAWPAFMLVRDMVDAMVWRQSGGHNLLAGQSTRVLFDSNAGKADPVEARAQMFPPIGPPVPMRVDGGAITVTDVDAPGVHWLRTSGATSGFSVNLPNEDTDLTRIDPSVLDNWLGSGQYNLVHNVDEVRQAEGRGQPTRSLYAVILLGMMAAFVLEQLLANRFYAARSGNASAAPPIATGAAEKWAAAR